MQKIAIIVLSVLLVFSLIGCSNNEEIKTDTTKKTEDTASATDTTRSSSYSSSSKSSSASKTTHYCYAPDCTREGTKSYAGIGGQTEYYCLTHYNEIIDIMSDMEEEVGKSSYNKHNSYDSDYGDYSSNSDNDFDEGYSYDKSDPYYSSNDHNNDGKISDQEFQDAMGYLLDDLASQLE